MTPAVPLPRYALAVRDLDPHAGRSLLCEFPDADSLLRALTDWLGTSNATPLPPPTPGRPPPRLRMAVLASVRARPGTCAEVCARFPQTPPSSIRGRLATLKDAGLITRDAAGLYRGAP
jgi:hypothetical protein